jgi:hypothetical protein
VPKSRTGPDAPRSACAGHRRASRPRCPCPGAQREG